MTFSQNVKKSHFKMLFAPIYERTAILGCKCLPDKYITFKLQLNLCLGKKNKPKKHF